MRIRHNQCQLRCNVVRSCNDNFEFLAQQIKHAMTNISFVRIAGRFLSFVRTDIDFVAPLCELVTTSVSFVAPLREIVRIDFKLVSLPGELKRASVICVILHCGSLCRVCHQCDTHVLVERNCMCVAHISADGKRRQCEMIPLISPH